MVKINESDWSIFVVGSPVGLLATGCDNTGRQVPLCASQNWYFHGRTRLKIGICLS